MSRASAPLMGSQTGTYPILPIRNRILLPETVIRVKVARPASVALIKDRVERALSERSTAAVYLALLPLLVTTGDGKAAVPNTREGVIASVEPPEHPPSKASASGTVPASQLHPFGCLARVVRLEKSNETDVKYVLILEGVQRIRLKRFISDSPYFVGEFDKFTEPVVDRGNAELEASIVALKTIAREFLDLLQELKLPSAVLTQMRRYIESSPPGQLADLLTATLDVSLKDKLEVLEAVDLRERLDKTRELISKQLQVLKLSQRMSATVEGKLSKKQRELMLRQQLKAIQEELGEKGDPEEENELDELQKKLEEAQLPEEVDKVAQRELKRLKRMHNTQAEYSVVRNYLEWLAEMPWNISTESVTDIAAARQQLDADHHGLEKVKKRIIEYLAVRKLRQEVPGPILCFIGPPGVGKTSLGRSIATALGRKFHRISLGGVRDEAEVRGHRRTYVGALPGRIVQGFKKSGSNNPVLLLDEIDKLGKDIRGDPAAALLEVLDPEQNAHFTDHYLGVPLDLSKTLFIATANESDTIPPALLDRMEVIRIPGYTFEEKVAIARDHLLPRQLRQHGLSEGDLHISEAMLMHLAVNYTREAGVRSLERQIAALCRHVAVEKANGHRVKEITPETMERLLGPSPFDDETSERASLPGVATGLAWTASGAGGLLYIEATWMPGTGKLTLTGMLGDVIKESAQAALSWVRSNQSLLPAPLPIPSTTGTPNVNELLRLGSNTTDIHIHFPAGAVPKDGPSAGVTIVTALVSLITNRPVRPKTAMTGEITLRGLVLPVGGIKEKVLAAHRAGIERVILPFRNRKDLEEVPIKVRESMEFIFAKQIGDVLGAAFGDPHDASTAKDMGRVDRSSPAFMNQQQFVVKSKL